MLAALTSETGAGIDVLGTPLILDAYPQAE